MHLGRFHAVITDIALHFKHKEFLDKLNNCTREIANYASNHAETHLQSFKQNLESLYKASEIENHSLSQPYAKDVIAELGLEDAFSPKLREIIDTEIRSKSFDVQALSQSLIGLRDDLTKKVKSVLAVDDAFTELGVEYQRVFHGESEVGLLIPREIVGDSVASLSGEFAKIGRLARAINEISGADDYDPKVVTISSSWWQIFLETDSAQILIWVAAIERIVAIYKSGLEIRSIQKQMQSQNLPEAVIDQMDSIIQEKFTQGIQEIAKEIRNNKAEKVDDARANELENQLRQGLSYLADRIVKGTQIEINVSLPKEIKSKKGEEENPSPELIEEIKKSRERLEFMRALRDKAQAASIETIGLEESGVRLLLEDDENSHN